MNEGNNKKAVILLSGGLDSSTTLAIAKNEGFDCYALTVVYGQRHMAEINAAKKIARHLNVAEHRIIDINLAEIVTSALTDTTAEIPQDRPLEQIGAHGDVPSTYVPARNLVFLSIAGAWAESIGASDIFIGVNVLDYSGYPDCRPEFISAFETALNTGTREGGFKVHAPLISMSKAEIIRTGTQLGLDYSLTVSCYAATEDGKACGKCDACQLRKKGFEEAGIPDPTQYQT